MKMKKFLCLILICLFSNVFLLGCNRDPYKIEKVDGYSIVRIRERDREGITLVGVDDSNLINNTFIVPEKIDGETVLSLGCEKLVYWAVDDSHIIKFENNPNVHKIVFNNDILICPHALDLCATTLKEIEVNHPLRKSELKYFDGKNVLSVKMILAKSADYEWMLHSYVLRQLIIDYQNLYDFPRFNNGGFEAMIFCQRKQQI